MDRPRIDDRVAFTPIVFVLLTDVPWRMVPAAGVWERLHRELRRRLNAAGLDRLDADSSIQATFPLFKGL